MNAISACNPADAAPRRGADLIAMPEIRFGGLNAFYRTWGEGTPVVFLHSGGSSGAQWEKTARFLGSDCQMIAPDFLGFGDTDAWPQAGALTHDLQAELVNEVIGHAIAGAADAVDVVGHSYGGATAIRLVLARPQAVRSLVLIEPVLNCLLHDAADPLAEESVAVARAFIASVDAGRPEVGWQAFIDSRNTEGTWAGLSDAQRQRFLAQSAQAREGFVSNLQNPTTLADCRRIAVPVTIVRGSEALPADRRIAELLAEAVAGARSTVIPHAGHMSPLTHPAEVAAIVRDHLQRLA